jgi:hypothetical protein
MPLVVEMLAKETMRVSADNVRAGSLRLGKLSTQSGAPSMFDTFFESRALLVDQDCLPYTWTDVGFEVADIHNIWRGWR